MSSFARTLNKAPAYLTPRRPPMPGRTFSNSSELSLASNDSRPAQDFGDVASSAPGTPMISPLDGPRSTNNSPDSPALKPQNFFASKPITIELPKVKKKTNSVYTPTEVLSARGDLPGGYFPLHEDPKTRIHRPHPFQLEVHQSTPEKSQVTQVTQVTMRERTSSRDTVSPQSSMNTPVSSYLPAGIDHPLPVGKYYPSNYEKRGQSLVNQRNFVSESVTSYAKTDVHGSTYNGGPDARQRLQQYQRDMVAQAAMALGGSFKGNARGAMAGLPIADLRLTSASPQKPLSPQLMPMGSPGPVTPMELESSTGYLEKGKVPSQLSKENVAPTTTQFTPHSL